MKWQVYNLDSLQPVDIVHAYDSLINDSVVCIETTGIESLINDYLDKTSLSSKLTVKSFTNKSINLLINVDLRLGKKYSIIGIQFLIELFCKLKRIFNDVIILFYDDEQTSGNLFRLSHMLYPWCNFHSSIDKVFYVDFATRKKQALKDNILSHEFHNVLPLCQLSLELVQRFALPYNYRSSDRKTDAEASYYHNFITNYVDGVIDERTKLNKLEVRERLIDNAPLLAVLLFAKCIEIYKKTEIDQISVFETCISFAQGIIQIMENALIHPSKESESIAFFSFRFHTDKDLKSNKKRSKTITDYYFLFPPQWDSKLVVEFSVSDIALEEKSNQGIVKQFKNKSSLSSKIGLDDIFNYSEDEFSEIQGVFSNPSQIANHYGLQIFSNMVTGNNGFFSVISDNEKHIGLADNTQKDIIKENKKRFEAFEGTTYSVVCPINAYSSESLTYNGIANTSTRNILVNDIPEYDSEVLERDDVSRILSNISFNGEFMHKKMFETIVREKETIVLRACGIIQKNYLHDRSTINFVIKCGLSFIEVELLCKVFFVLLTNKVKYNINHLAIQFDAISDCVYAARLFSLFYDRRGMCKLVEKNTVLLYASEGEDHTQIFLSGSNLVEAFNGLKNQYVNGCLEASLYNHAKAIIGRRSTDKNISKEFVSDIVSKHCVTDYKTGKLLINQELIHVLNNDVHDKNRLGCKISNTHIRVSGVHLDTFYEAQFLFGNTYWCNAFAVFLFIRISKYIKEHPSSEPVVLYGYELYSADVMYKTKEMLESVLDREIYVLFYEKGDPGEDSNRVRYIDDIKKIEDVTIFYFVGISSTLSTFNRMHNALECEMKNHNITCKFNDTKCFSIIQIVGDDPVCREYISFEEKAEYNRVRSVKNHLDFIPGLSSNRYSEYMVAVSSKWNKAGECALCKMQFGPSGKKLERILERLEEKVLIEVNETSVVPTMLYDLGELPTKTPKKPVFDIRPIKKGEYVYCDHVERNGNHYQYYLRLSKLYRDYRANVIEWLENLPLEPEYEDWFKEINNPNYINIIVSPHQYSKNSFVDDVNSRIFNGGAHTIIFDVNKEYRKNFIAKYDFFAKSIQDNSKEIRLFFVTDQIVSGQSFFRAKSLASSLFEMWDNKNVFYGIFVLLNRNSGYSKKSLIKPNKSDIPYFSFIDLFIPSLRINYDSCPICNKVTSLKNALYNCSLNPLAKEFQEEIISLRVKSIRTVHNLYSDSNDSANESTNKSKINNTREKYNINFDRMQCENYMWRTIKQSTHPVFILLSISRMLKTNHSDSCRRLSMFVECLSQPLLFYRESIKNYIMPFLVELFYEIVSGFLKEQDDLPNILMFFKHAYQIEEKSCEKSFVEYDSFFEGENLEDYNLINLLFGNNIIYDEKMISVLISIIKGLSNISSNALLDINNIISCYKVSEVVKDKAGTMLRTSLMMGIKFVVCSDKDKSCFVDYQDENALKNNTNSSKALVLSNNIENYLANNKIIDINQNAWLTMLYMESISYNYDSDNIRIWFKNYENNLVQNKYQIIVDNMKKTNESFNDIDLQICVDHREEEYKSIIIDDRKLEYKKIKREIEKYGFYVDESKIYILLSNNYRSREDISISEWESLFGSSKSIDAVIVLEYKAGISDLDKIKHAREVLVYKNLLAQNLYRDFEENIFGQYFTNKDIVLQLGSAPLCLHRGSVLSGFTKYLVKIDNNNQDLYFEIISHYANTLITFANLGRIVGSVPEGVRVNLSPDVSKTSLSHTKCVLDCFKKAVGKQRVKDNFGFLMTKLEDLKTEYVLNSPELNPHFFSLTNESTTPYDLSVLLYVFLENALSHGDDKKTIDVNFTYVPENRSFDLTITNYKKSSDKHSRMITIPSLKYLFNAFERDQINPTPVLSIKETKKKYIVKIETIIYIDFGR